ncbi:MAG: hypothetical protein WBQ25_08785, partial [Nitrososphaeraceae archaeon]
TCRFMKNITQKSHMIGCWKAKMMLAHLLIKESKCISVLLAVHGPLGIGVTSESVVLTDLV